MGRVASALRCIGLSIGALGASVFAVSSPASALRSHATATPVHVVSLAAGAGQSLALLSDGTVMAWGDNNAGDLGIGTDSPSLTPVRIPGLSGVKAIAAAEGSSSYALLDNGTVMAWGDNSSGQLGNSTMSASNVPVKIRGLKSVVAISAMDGGAFAVRSNGTVMAWGIDGIGQLGNGKRSSNACFCTLPVKARLAGVKSVAGDAIGAHALAVLSNGTVEAFGANGNGEIGNGTITSTAVVTPVAAKGVSGAIAVAGGNWTSMALLSDGTVMTWGYDGEGQLGNGALGGVGCGCVDTAQTVRGLSGVTEVSAGAFFNLALLSNGNVMAWGDDGVGELGIGSTTLTGCHCVDAPVKTMVSGATLIAAGTEHGLALLQDGSVVAWGAGNAGQLGDGIAADSDVPVTVLGLP